MSTDRLSNFMKRPSDTEIKQKRLIPIFCRADRPEIARRAAKKIKAAKLNRQQRSCFKCGGHMVLYTFEQMNHRNPADVEVVCKVCYERLWADSVENYLDNVKSEEQL